MTNTESYMDEQAHAELVERAEALGKEHGKSEAGWRDIDSSNAQWLIDLDEEGDFDRFDDAVGFRAPLSGEFADDLTPHKLLDELDAPPMNDGEEHDVVQGYENAFREAFVDEILRRARYHAED